MNINDSINDNENHKVCELCLFNAWWIDTTDAEV